MIKRTGIVDRVVTAIIESAILVLYLTEHISESAALVLGLLGVVYLFSSVFSNILPINEAPEAIESRITIDVQS